MAGSGNPPLRVHLRIHRKVTCCPHKLERPHPSRHRPKRDWLGWRVGRNPPSVLGDIHLIGIPAPQAVFTGAYYPFHGVGWLFTLTVSLLNASASSSTTDGGIFLRLYPTSRPTPRGVTLPPRGWSFLRPSRRVRSRPPTRQPNNPSSHLR